MLSKRSITHTHSSLVWSVYFTMVPIRYDSTANVSKALRPFVASYWDA